VKEVSKPCSELYWMVRHDAPKFHLLWGSLQKLERCKIG